MIRQRFDFATLGMMGRTDLFAVSALARCGLLEPHVVMLWAACLWETMRQARRVS